MNVVEALRVVLQEIEVYRRDPDLALVHVGVEDAHDRLTTNCEEPELTRLEYAPHRVYVEIEDDEIETGYTELISSKWKETDTYWCHGCDTQLDGELIARAHVNGIDLTGAWSNND